MRSDLAELAHALWALFYHTGNCAILFAILFAWELGYFPKGSTASRLSVIGGLLLAAAMVARIAWRVAAA